ncbi:hypothetical protein FOZ63_020993, partial [Perkinsus olseni]
FSAGRRGNINPVGSPLRSTSRPMKILDCCFLDIVAATVGSSQLDISSKTITGILETRLIDQVGVPRIFTVDNARYFTGTYFRGWVASIGATLRSIPVASPHRNRQHSGLKRSLKALCAEHPESWPAYVTKAQRRINTRSTYGHTPQ